MSDFKLKALTREAEPEAICDMFPQTGQHYSMWNVNVDHILDEQMDNIQISNVFCFD